MEWKDILTEIRLKLTQKNRKRIKRKPAFQRYSIDEIISTSTVVKSRTIVEIEHRLKNRSITSNYLFTDNRIFEPLVDLMVINLQGPEFHSFVFNIAIEIKRIVENYENLNRITVNKGDLYFTLALCSIYQNATFNASIFWELSQIEEAKTLRTHYNATASLQSSIERFASAINPIEFGLNGNNLYDNVRNHYSWIPDFKKNLLSLNDPQVFSYFSCGLKNRLTSHWLKTNFTEMSKMNAQEIINSLCILSESMLKLYPGVTRHNTLGRILSHELTSINATVSTIIEDTSVNPRRGLKVQYPTGTTTEFNTNFPNVINAIKGRALNDDELKAHVIYGIYMLRNKTLHDYNPSLTFYTNNILFEDALGLCFLGVPIINNL